MQRARVCLAKRRVVVPGLALLIGVVCAVPAAAQRMHGRLLDLESNRPIVAGLLTLLTSDSVSMTTAVSDADGQWMLSIPAPGWYFLEAKGMGYRPWVAGPMELQPGDDLDAVFHLQRLPVMLKPIDVTVAAMHRHLELSGFYERQRADFGHFMTPEEIDRRQASTLTQLVSAIPGVNIVSMTNGTVGARFIQLRGGSLARGEPCRPRVFVDGLMYSRGDSQVRRDDPDTEQRLADEFERVDQGLNIDDIGHPSTIAAIEIYRSAAQVPVQFGGSSIETQCGVIVIWTRTGRMRTAAGTSR